MSHDVDKLKIRWIWILKLYFTLKVKVDHSTEQQGP